MTNPASSQTTFTVCSVQFNLRLSQIIISLSSLLHCGHAKPPQQIITFHKMKMSFFSLLHYHWLETNRLFSTVFIYYLFIVRAVGRTYSVHSVIFHDYKKKSLFHATAQLKQNCRWLHLLHNLYIFFSIFGLAIFINCPSALVLLLNFAFCAGQSALCAADTRRSSPRAKIHLHSLSARGNSFFFSFWFVWCWLLSSLSTFVHQSCGEESGTRPKVKWKNAEQKVESA